MAWIRWCGGTSKGTLSDVINDGVLNSNYGTSGNATQQTGYVRFRCTSLATDSYGYISGVDFTDFNSGYINATKTVSGSYITIDVRVGNTWTTIYNQQTGSTTVSGVFNNISSITGVHDIRVRIWNYEGDLNVTQLKFSA